MRVEIDLRVVLRSKFYYRLLGSSSLWVIRRVQNHCGSFILYLFNRGFGWFCEHYGLSSRFENILASLDRRGAGLTASLRRSVLSIDRLALMVGLASLLSLYIEEEEVEEVNLVYWLADSSPAKEG